MIDEFHDISHVAAQINSFQPAHFQLEGHIHHFHVVEVVGAGSVAGSGVVEELHLSAQRFTVHRLGYIPVRCRSARIDQSELLERRLQQRQRRLQRRHQLQAADGYLRQVDVARHQI